MDLARVAQFDGFVRRTGVSEKQRNLLVSWFQNFVREITVQQSVVRSEDMLNVYCGQIIDMFKKHPGLSDDVYRDYIKLAFENCFKKSKVD